MSYSIGRGANAEGGKNLLPLFDSTSPNSETCSINKLYARLRTEWTQVADPKKGKEWNKDSVRDAGKREKKKILPPSERGTRKKTKTKILLREEDGHDLLSQQKLNWLPALQLELVNFYPFWIWKSSLIVLPFHPSYSFVFSSNYTSYEMF